MDIKTRTWKRTRRGILGLLTLWVLLLLSALGVRAEDIGRVIEKQYGLYPDFATDMRVQYIGHRIALTAGLPNSTFIVYNDKELNAMALPDGRVFVTSKMATLVSDDELAFVLGHELTHIKEKHAQRQQQRATGGALLGAILVGILGGGEDAIRMGADILGGLTYGHYSQKDEYKADAGGVRLMSQCGYDAKKAADAMQRLLDLYGRGDASTPILGWFASHPDTKNRKQRLLDAAKVLEKTPLPKTADTTGVEITLDPSAEHASGWAHSYLSILINAYGEGRTVALPYPQYPVHALMRPPVEPKKDDKDKNKKEEPLQAVTFVAPKVPTGYRVTLSLRAIPAGRAAALQTAEGTAVEVTLHWTQVASGFTGNCVAIAQMREKVSWQAQEQLDRIEKQFELADGKSENIEGTLECIALRRAARALAEIMEANAPVDHGAQVTVSLKTEKLRPGDYVLVVRDNLIIAEVCLVQITGKKSATGTVLWGSHTWKKKDKFVADL